MRCAPVGGTVPIRRVPAANSERWFPARVLCVTTGVPGVENAGPSYSVTVKGRYAGRSVSYFIFAGMCGNDQAFAGWWMRILHLPLP
jgi:hypothetical protein